MPPIPAKYRPLVEKHVESLGWMRDLLLEMDSLAKPVLGIGAWDDSVVVALGQRQVIISVDGPYKKRLVMKSALIHAATDVVVKGGMPLFALDTVAGSEEDIREMMKSLKKQALAMKIPILGGNTMEGEYEPAASLTVVGELVTKKPIKDSGGQKGDVLAVLGDPIWGTQDERLMKAQNLFKAWYRILEEEVDIHAAKDVTKGGLISCVYELAKKSLHEFCLEEEVPFSLTRNLDNFLLALSEEEYGRISTICSETGTSLVKVGELF